MKSRKQLLALICLTLSCGALPTLAKADVNVVIGVAPPAVHYSARPAHRHGYVWAPGYWHWQGGNHAWVGGRWLHERHGYRWSPERWHHRGTRYHFEPGRWQRDHHYGASRNRWDDRGRNQHRRGHRHHRNKDD